VTTPKLALPELSVSQAGKEITHNQALAILDQLAQGVIVDKDLATPPGSPANGAAYIVATGATGAWAGKDGQIAYWLTSVGVWSFVVPVNGWSFWVTDEAKRYELSGGVWGEQSGGGGSPAVTTKATSFTLGLTDVNTHMRSTAATDITVTIAPQASVAWTNNTEMRFEQDGSGAIVFAPGAGVTIQKKPSSLLKTAYKQCLVTLKRTATDTWSLLGEIAPIPTNCAIRSSAKALSASTSSLSVNKPAGTIDGDILIAFAASGANAAIASTGWTKHTENVSVAGSFAIFSKTAASEGASWNFTCSTERMGVHVLCIKGATAVDVFGAIPGTDSGATGVAASVTPASAGILLGGFFSTASSATTDGPSNMTVVDTLSQTYQQINVYSEIVSSGATGTRSATWAGAMGSKTQALICVK